MDKFDRIHKLHDIFHERRVPVPIGDLVQQLDCTESTVYRLIKLLRDYMGAPLEFDRQLRGYRYVRTGDGQRYQLPGLWFSATELRSLLVLQQLLVSLGAGLLESHLAPLSKRIDELLRHKRLGLPLWVLSSQALSWRGSCKPRAHAAQVGGAREPRS